MPDVLDGVKVAHLGGHDKYNQTHYVVPSFACTHVEACAVRRGAGVGDGGRGSSYIRGEKIGSGHTGVRCMHRIPCSVNATSCTSYRMLLLARSSKQVIKCVLCGNPRLLLPVRGMIRKTQVAW